MKRIRNAFVADIAFSALTVAACSSTHGPGGTGTGSYGSGGGVGQIAQDGTGQVGMHLTLAPGVSLTSASWTITGPNMYSGTVQIGDAESLEFVAGGILAGSGYTVTIHGTDSQGDMCTGTSAPFSITAGAVTQAVLVVTCTQVNEASVNVANVANGSVQVDAGLVFVSTDGGVFNCPGITSFSISPAEINLSGSAVLTTLTTGAPSTVTYSASPASGGTFTAAGFMCSGSAAQVTVTATATANDAATAAACVGQPFQSISALVNCESAADSGTTPLPDSGQDTGPLTSCHGNVGGVCDATQVLLVEHNQSCYDCLLTMGCLDDAPPPVSFGDTGHECSDVTGNTLVPGETRTQACLDVLSCTLAHSSAQPVLAFGYCGPQPTTTSCQTATPGQTGPCLLQEQTGLESTDPTTILARYTNTAFGGGMANAIFQCALANACQTCLQ
jgi:hypothetical protein